MEYCVNLSDVNLSDLAMAGGKNASTGEMIQNLSHKGIQIPGGFVTTAYAYQKFLSQHKLDQKINQILLSINFKSVDDLNKKSSQIRQAIVKMPFPSELEKEITKFCDAYKNIAVAVRSSATSEDLPEASFAGQQETYLNIRGTQSILHAIKLVYASLFTSRAIAYRHDHGFEHTQIGISVGIQPMIRSDKGVSGVMFTMDTESGFDKVILINASYGLGEIIVQGQVNPDEFYVYKPSVQNNQFAILQRKLGHKSHKMVYGKKNQIKTISVPPSSQNKYCLSDEDIHALARYALIIEEHYKKPMDIEWAKDGLSGKLYILQARPETVKSQQSNQVIERYSLSKKGKILAKGFSVGEKIGFGKSHLILDYKKINEFKSGEILVTDMTDPDWEPIMKNAAGIVTNRGGRTCHAAIVARELGIPAVVGCGNATSQIKNNENITVSCAEGETGFVYADKIPFKINKILVKDLPKLPLKIGINLGNPDKAFSTQFLPNEGVGLARLEFIISQIGIHPNSVLNIKKLPSKIQKEIYIKTSTCKTPLEFYFQKLCEGISKISAAFYPKPVIFRFSDFKSNEYANLLGGNFFEENEENPMLGFRGASRYIHPKFKDCFEIECKAFKFVRETMGLTNTAVMIPFVRTVEELSEVITLMENFGLKREENLKIYMMCEVPSNVILAESFLSYVDGFSIGSNDLTQLTLGLDRDSHLVAPLFDERNEAIKLLLSSVIKTCNKMNKYVGICGQGPSDHPDFAVWLMQEGIQNISLNADSVVNTWLFLANPK